MLFTPDRQLTWRRRQSGVSIVFSTHAGYCLGAHGFIHAGLRVHEPTRLFDEMVLILAIEAWIFTLWYLERASARGGAESFSQFTAFEQPIAGIPLHRPDQSGNEQSSDSSFAVNITR